VTTAQDIVAEAREWLGTPWNHQERLKGVGTDCAGLVIGIAKARLDFKAPVPAYSRTPGANNELLKLCRKYMTPVRQPALGRVAVMRFEGEKLSHHLGIFGDYPLGGLSLIHGYATSRKVVEHRLDEIWLDRVAAVFILPGVVE
jgi:cell wall-associated NlpC family hydrolase